MRIHLVLASTIVLAACSSTGNKSSSPAAPAPAKPVASPSAAKADAATTDVPKTSAVAGAVECSVPGDKRLLQVRAQGKGCELAYTKGGTEGVVASSANGTAHCESVLSKIQARLTGAGFTCK
jgi:hypothetical protein